MNLSLRQKMILSQNNFYNWKEISAKTEKVIVLE